MTISFGDNLNKLRKSKDLTQEEFAKAMRVSSQAVSKWERGETYPDMELLPVIANYFNISIDSLLMQNSKDNIIREATVDDCISICKICKNDLGYNCDTELVKFRLEHLDKNREVVFVAEVNEAIVGFVHAETYNTLYFNSMVNIQGLAIDSEFRHKGYGKELMLTIENWARSRGISFVRLNSGGERGTAHKFYRAIGYNNEKEQIRFMKNID